MPSPKRDPKTGVYSVRVAYPKDVRAKLGWEYKRSLGTRSPVEAKRLMPAKLMEFDRQVAAARQAPDAVELSTYRCQQLAHRWLLSALELDAKIRQHADLDEWLPPTAGEEDDDWQTVHELELWHISDIYSTAKAVDYVRKDVDAILAEEGLPVAPDSVSYRRLADQLIEAYVILLRTKKCRAEGDWRSDAALARYPKDTPAQPSTTNAATTSTTKTTPQTSATGEPLSMLFQDWCDERRPNLKTRDEAQRAVRRFIELHGDIPGSSITRRQVRELKNALMKLPRVRTGATTGLTLPELLEAIEKEPPAETLSVRSVNKDLSCLSAVLSWAGKNGYFDHIPQWSNPTQGVQVQQSKSEADRRLPYDSDDLRRIFTSPVFTEGHRPKAGHGEAAKWLPLLALFTGARMEELGQLYCPDIAKERGIWRIDINTLQDGKRVKTKSSRRKIPVHAELTRLGFLDYVAYQRRRGSERLFPELVPDSRGHLTSNWSKWWGRYVRQLGITDKRKVFHSFRHSFKDAARNAGIDKDIHDALTGHAHGDVGSTYGIGYTVPTLNEAIQKIRYEGLFLPDHP